MFIKNFRKKNSFKLQFSHPGLHEFPQYSLKSGLTQKSNAAKSSHGHLLSSKHGVPKNKLIETLTNSIYCIYYLVKILCQYTIS